MEFYWRHARESLLTEKALQMYQLLALREGERFDDVKQAIDADYEAAIGRTSSNTRHGGIIQSAIQVYREAGWATLDDSGIIQITPAGKQALILLGKTPDFLKAAPHFLVELLARHQLNNPARPNTAKNAEYDAQLRESTVFPYWTLFKIIRGCGDYIATSELKRFVFKIKRQEDVEGVIKDIIKFREAKNSGKTDAELDEMFPVALEGAIGEPKYLMGRLGTQVGKIPPLLEKDGLSTWRLNKYYIPLVDEVLSHQPLYKDYLDEQTWMKDYGSSVNLDDLSPTNEINPEQLEPLVSEIEDDDSIFHEVKEIVDSNYAGVLFSGPPGTSKSWYARQIAVKLVEGDPTRVSFIQFHPSMSYDDFVEGYVPHSDGQNSTFEIKKKIFLKLCTKAKEIAPAVCVLVIDEINRGDTSRIFGELLTYIEASYRGVNFTSAYSGATMSVPKNLFIIGTFNPFDKSVVELDDAMDRRFERISFDPSPKLLVSLLKKNGVEDTIIDRVAKYFVDVNKLTRHGIGHTLFLSITDDNSLNRLWNRKLQFIFEKAFRFDADSFTKAKEQFMTLYSEAANANI